jgi:hypothetical protein
MRVNCYIPITVRIVGVPSDDQLAELARSLTRVVAARLAEAQRLIAHRHGAHGGVHLPPTGRIEPLRITQRPNEPIDRPLDLSGTEHLLEDLETFQGLRPTIPGDFLQQQYALPSIGPNIWFRFTNLHAEFERIARRAAENPNPKRNVRYWLARFRDEFEGSLSYILERRQTRAYKVARKRIGASVRGLILHDLQAAEDAAIKENQQLGGYGSQAALVGKIDELRKAAKQRWDKEIDDTAARFLVLARNHAEFEAFRQVGVKGFKIAGLPADVEPTVPATARPDLFEQDADSPGFAESMIKIMEAIQARYGHPVVAINYHGHAEANASFGSLDNVGKYSVDIDISRWAPVNSDGFYDHAGAVAFFMAVEAATGPGDFAWLAFYNDFAVAEEVNRRTGKYRIQFSGAGGPPNPTPDKKNSYHHGPAPFILHIHMNFMPISLALQYVAGKNRDDLQYFDFGGN